VRGAGIDQGLYIGLKRAALPGCCHQSWPVPPGRAGAASAGPRIGAAPVADRAQCALVVGTITYLPTTVPRRVALPLLVGLMSGAQVVAWTWPSEKDAQRSL